MKDFSNLTPDDISKLEGKELVQAMLHATFEDFEVFEKLVCNCIRKKLQDIWTGQSYGGPMLLNADNLQGASLDFALLSITFHPQEIALGKKLLQDRIGEPKLVRFDLPKKDGPSSN